MNGDLIEASKVIKGFGNVNRGEWFDLQSREQSRPNPGRKATSLGSKTKINDWLNPVKENCNDEKNNNKNDADDNVDGQRMPPASLANKLANLKQQNYAEVHQQFSIHARESSSALDGGIPSDETSTDA